MPAAALQASAPSTPAAALAGVLKSCGFELGAPPNPGGVTLEWRQAPQPA